MTGIEFDHADIFRDLDHVRQAFGTFISNMPAESKLMACDDDRNIDLLVQNCPQVYRYGMKEGSDWQLGHVSIDPPWTRFEVSYKGERWGRFKTGMPGVHNLLNTLSAIGVVHHLGLSQEDISVGLASFKGVKRRQEIRGIQNGITVIDDFAHHPTAVKETIRAMKPFCTNGRLIAVFEPRTNTSMRSVFQDVYPPCFDLADLVCIRQPSMLKKIPAGQRFSSQRLVDDLKSRGQSAYYFEHTDSMIPFLVKQARSGDVVLIMSNGGFDNIHQRLLRALQYN
jgi:UDP-N-acetylmuramate: L-alanyl-gamma-D-glutamyl-meso-diaminopimelate ligase